MAGRRTIVPEALVKSFAILCNNKVAILNSVGLLLTLVGVVLLFRYGMPYQVRTGGVRLIQFEVGNPPDQKQIKLERRYDLLGWVGLICIVVGTVCQIITNWV
jgi:hypothetical protein